jgi:hypothetical protein
MFQDGLQTKNSKEYGNETDFYFFLYKLVRHRSLTQLFIPFRFWRLIQGNIRNRKSTPCYQGYRESPRNRYRTLFFKPSNKPLGIVKYTPSWFFA